MDKKAVIIFICVIVIGVLVGGGFYFFSKNNVQKQKAEPVKEESLVIPTLTPEEIGLKLTKSTSGQFAGHGVVMTISRLDGIDSIECEFTYNAGDLPRGGICKSVTVKPGDTIIKQEYPYGTCSNVCHFDKDISDVKMIVKVTKKDGKTYQVDASL